MKYQRLLTRAIAYFMEIWGDDPLEFAMERRFNPAKEYFNID